MYILSLTGKYPQWELVIARLVQQPVIAHDLSPESVLVPALEEVPVNPFHFHSCHSSNCHLKNIYTYIYQYMHDNFLH